MSFMETSEKTGLYMFENRQAAQKKTTKKVNLTIGTQYELWSWN